MILTMKVGKMLAKAPSKVKVQPKKYPGFQRVNMRHKKLR